jgi:hypothetical protein
MANLRPLRRGKIDHGKLVQNGGILQQADGRIGARCSHSVQVAAAKWGFILSPNARLAPGRWSHVNRGRRQSARAPGRPPIGRGEQALSCGVRRAPAALPSGRADGTAGLPRRFFEFSRNGSPLGPRRNLSSGLPRSGGKCLTRPSQDGLARGVRRWCTCVYRVANGRIQALFLATRFRERRVETAKVAKEFCRRRRR